MMAQGVQRMDALYIEAFNAGLLRPNPTLITPREYLPVAPPPPPTELPEETGLTSGEETGDPSVPSGPAEPQVQEVPAPTPRPPPSPPPAPPGFGPRGVR